MNSEKWLESKVTYLRGLKNPTEQQKLLLLLVEKEGRSSEDERKLAALVRAEKAQERAQKARVAAGRIVNAEKVAARKSRDRELYQSAGLMILAGLVDTKTGKPTLDRGELLGALIALKNAQADDSKRLAWKRKGDEILAKKKEEN